MAKRTLLSCWKQYEKLSSTYLLNANTKEKTLEKLQVLTEKANGDQIGNALFTLFVSPYLTVCNAVEFTVIIEETFPSWQTKFDEPSGIITIHPISVFNFIQEIRQLTTPRIVSI